MKRSFTTKLRDAFYEVDRYDRPVHFNLEGDETLKSSLGSIISMGIIIFLLTQFFIQVSQMLKHVNPQIIQMNEFQSDPAYVNLTQAENFVFAVGITKDGASMDLTQNSIVSFKATYSQYIRSTSGTTTKIKSKLYFEPCTQTSFPESVFGPDVFSTYSLELAYCPSYIDFTASDGSCPSTISAEYPTCRTPPSFRIRGTYLSLDFRFIQFKLTQCQSSDSAYLPGLQCASSSTMSSTFAASEIKVNFYYANNLITPINYNMPNQSYIDSIYWTINPSVAKLADVFLDAQTVQNYDSYVFSDHYSNTTYYSIQPENMREIQEFQGGYLLEWNIRRSNINHVTTRIYTKVLDIVGNIGGISEMIFLLGGVVLLQYVKYKYKMTLSNELYDFQSPEEQRREQEKMQAKSEEIPKNIGRKIELGMLVNSISPTTSITPTRNNREKISTSILKLFTKKKVSNEDMTVKDYFTSLQRKKRRLPFSEFHYVKSLLLRMFCRKPPDEVLAQKARNQVTKDLDIITVIEKLKEVDKMKMLLLNHHQREAFNFIEKPLITLHSDNPLHKLPQSSLTDIDSQSAKGAVLEIREEYDSVSKYAKLYATYRNLMEDQEPLNAKYNKKLLDMMGGDVIDVFRQIDKRMGNYIDPKKFEATVQSMLGRNGIRIEEHQITFYE